MKTLIIYVLFTLFLTVSISGQVPQPSTSHEGERLREAELLVAKLKTAEMLLKLCEASPTNELCKDKDPAADVARLYSDLVRDVNLSKAVAAYAVSSFAGLRAGASSAMQVSQAADEAGVKMQLILIAQNQRIIELLEQLVKKK